MKAKQGKSVGAKSGYLDRERVVHKLHQVMQGDNSLSRCCATRGLVRLGAQDAVSTRHLIDALLDPDPDVRVDAVEALGHLRLEAAVEPLLVNIEGDPEGDVRITAVKALAEIGSAVAVDGLIRCIRESGYPELDHMMDDTDFGACWEVQSGALKALGKIGNAGAVQPLIAFLTGEESEGLQEIGFQALAELDDKRAEEFLIERLKNAEPLARRQAAQALSTMLDMSASDDAMPVERLNALNDALLDSDPSVRMYAARALGAGGNPMVAVPLTLLLNDPEPEVRHQAASLLGRIRGPVIVDRLHDLLRQADSKLKHPLVRVLGEIADAASYSPLHEVLKDCDPVKDQRLMYETIGALGAIGEPGPGGTLADILDDAGIQHTIRVQAARALGRIYGGEATSEGVEEEAQKAHVQSTLADAIYDENPQVSYAAISALFCIDRDRAVDRLIEWLQTDRPIPDPAASQKASEAEKGADSSLISQDMEAMIGNHDSSTSTLAAILEQPHPESDSPEPEYEAERRAANRTERRALAARLLGNVPDPGTQVLAALTEAGADSEAVVRKEAILALGRISDPSSVPVILNGLNATQTTVRLASVDALENFNDMETVNKRLASMFNDPDPHLRDRVLTILNASGGSEAMQILSRALEDEDRTVCTTALSRLDESVCDEQAASRTTELMFKFGGELRTIAAAALRRMNDYGSTARLLEILADDKQEDLHWICIDALAEMYAVDGIQVEL